MSHFLKNTTMKKMMLFMALLFCAIQASAQEKCTRCDGDGRLPDKCAFCKDGWRECDLCLGKKYILCTVCRGAKKLTCYNCSGRGYWIDKHDEQRTCQRCGGVGTPTCERCSGDGEIMCPHCEGAGGERCRQCDGSGNKWWKCPECDGKGYK